MIPPTRCWETVCSGTCFFSPPQYDDHKRHCHDGRRSPTISDETRRGCGQGDRKWAASGREINITGLIPSRMTGPGCRRFQEGYLPYGPVFGQFLSPRVFLMQVSGSRRVRQGKEKLHSHPGTPRTCDRHQSRRCPDVTNADLQQ